jgi:Domain of Unknown Function (DUF326)
MTRVAEMLAAHPKSLVGLDQAKLAECIEACFDCAQVCTACADACLAEEMVADLVRCIRTDLDCAAICATTGTILSRRTGSDASVLPVACVAMTVRATPTCMSTAGSVRRLAADVRRLAPPCSAIWDSSR